MVLCMWSGWEEWRNRKCSLKRLAWHVDLAKGGGASERGGVRKRTMDKSVMIWLDELSAKGLRQSYGFTAGVIGRALVCVVVRCVVSGRDFHQDRRAGLSCKYACVGVWHVLVYHYLGGDWGGYLQAYGTGSPRVDDPENWTPPLKVLKLT